VAATLKHFPGIGRIAADTHQTLPSLVTDCTGWNRTEAVPMAAGIKAGSALVMTGHVLMPAVGATGAPASLSPVVVTDLLKGAGQNGCDGLGFDGVSVTDSLQMQPALDAAPTPGSAEVQALLAGEDLLLMPTAPQAAVKAIESAVLDGTLPQARLTDAAVRVYALRLALARVRHPALAVVGSAAHQELAAEAVAAANGSG
jgi:beta-N-acetylhexosaminidase